jgi:hypothetical protein
MLGGVALNPDSAIPGYQSVRGTRWGTPQVGKGSVTLGYATVVRNESTRSRLEGLNSADLFRRCNAVAKEAIIR